MLTDGSSSLARTILSALELTRHSVVILTPYELDWSDSAAVDAYINQLKPDIVINTVGWHESLRSTETLFLEASNSVAMACAKHDVAVIHFSSFRVFGGIYKASYEEGDEVSPVSDVGHNFLLSEQAFTPVRHNICIRLSWLLDTDGDSLFRELLEMSSSPGEDIEVSYRRKGSPIPLARVARLVTAMVNQVLCGADNWGVFHLGSSDTCSAAELSEAVADILRRENSLRRAYKKQNLSDEELDQLGEPLSSVLSAERCRDDFGVKAVSWRSGLTPLVQHWLENR